MNILRLIDIRKNATCASNLSKVCYDAAKLFLAAAFITPIFSGKEVDVVAQVMLGVATVVFIMGGILFDQLYEFIKRGKENPASD